MTKDLSLELYEGIIKMENDDDYHRYEKLTGNIIKCKNCQGENWEPVDSFIFSSYKCRDCGEIYIDSASY